MSKSYLFSKILLFILLIPIITQAQATTDKFHKTSEPNIFKNESGETVEYLGLKKWTAQAVQDSLKKLAPDKPVHACEAVLKNNLGFTDAAVQSHLNPKTEEYYTLVTLVEPERNSNSNDYFLLPKKQQGIIEDWTAGYDLSDPKIRKKIVFGSQFWRMKYKGKPIMPIMMNSSQVTKEEKKFLKKFFDNLDDIDSPSDRKLAYKTLDSDGNLNNRLLASLVLLNYPIEEDAKHIMLKQIRSKSSDLSYLSTYTLRTMTQDSAQVNWSGSEESIKALISGTNVSELLPTLKILTKTKISPEMSDKILAGDTFLLHDYLQSSHQETQSTALAFIDQISNADLDNTKQALEWLAEYKK